MRTYEDLDAYINGGRTPKIGRTLQNNTRAERRENGDIAVRLHQTDILVFHQDGTVTYDVGDWFTVTTKDRLNTYGPLRIWSEKGQWWFSDRYGNGKTRYANGLVVGVDDDEVVSGLVDHRATDEANAKMAKRIDAYVKGYDDDEVARLREGAKNGDAAGDCLWCQFGNPFPDNTEHLVSHLDEGYRMISLVRNAAAKRGYVDPVLITMVTPPSEVRRLIKRYLKDHLLVKG